ncbi:hypothetical protein [Cyanobium sp. ATX 6F1]|uniref:hypothetical protein n=1 Tax=unclassified Cyanobium TaxID=2627006 RepID=UPI0020CFD094|nr:hypothetical protein [Cyanobium sp. ATX 6F1]MCP9916830.1 hypothetical protein [Cyanobium sp. ATX 6F1]
MSKTHLLVTGALFALCAGILVLFTDIEVGVYRWFSCGPLAAANEQRSKVCE